MGLLDGMLGNAAKIDPAKIQQEFSQILAKGEVVDAVMVLKSPKLEGDRLTFDVEVIEGNLAGGDGAVSVFLDIINLPMARRTSLRAAWSAGAYSCHCCPWRLRFA